MRLSFANGERADFVMEEGVVNLGSAEGNGLVLAGKDVAPWHARMILDARGAVLEIMDPTARTHVNARPVREKALLRHGDVLCLGRMVIALKADTDAAIGTVIPAESPTPVTPPQQPARVVLRGVSGSHFGKAIAVGERVVVGSAPGCNLVLDEPRVAARHAAIETAGDRIWLRDLESSDGSLVNGVRVRNAAIHPGDQLAFERSHFVVEAPGLPLRGETAGADTDASSDHARSGNAGEDADASEPSHGGIWWLIGAAALIALGLVLLIHRGI
jgi:pSer/pThr/pTyr-binding forkhead associated (FHA) protein